jgi:hypothetical protein
MAVMPAFCDSCGTAFPSGFDVSAGSILVGNKSGPCPNCGDMGSVPDGLVSFIGDTLKMLPVPGDSIDEYKKFSEFLKSSHKLRIPEKTFREKIEKDHKQFVFVTRFIGNKPSDFYTFIQALVAIIGLCIQVYEVKGRYEPPSTEKVLEALPGESKKLVPDTMKSAPKARSPKIGRNDKCPCGSGKKYKLCHGEII